MARATTTVLWVDDTTSQPITEVLDRTALLEGWTVLDGHFSLCSSVGDFYLQYIVHACESRLRTAISMVNKDFCGTIFNPDFGLCKTTTQIPLRYHLIFYYI
jgi:hypothetical protein